MIANTVARRRSIGVDPDLDELLDLAADRAIDVTVSDRARTEGHAHIELRDRAEPVPMLARFKNCAFAISWILLIRPRPNGDSLPVPLTERTCYCQLEPGCFTCATWQRLADAENARARGRPHAGESTGAAKTVGIDAKVAATLKARCALVGVQLHVTDGDDGQPLMCASRWGLTKAMRTVAEVEDFLRRMGAE